ncbi:MAG: TatD family hydrolase [Phycisphaerales bacterium]|nr:TatD family hydrolase [Phycisphaerales bacterium]
MILVDTHTHLYDEEAVELQDAHIRRAIEAGVLKMYMPNCDSGTIERMLQIAQCFPDNCYPMMGLHPCYVKDNYLEELAVVEAQLSKNNFVGVGEIGLDFYWDRTYAIQQRHAFEQQIDWALQYELPIIIHSRSATKECIDIVRKKQKGNLVSIFHCYSGTLEEAREIVDLGGYLGIGGVVTYKKTNLPEILHSISIQNIVLETDAPYLSPVPYRGKKNESTYLPIIGQKVAEVYQISLQEVAEQTTLNAQKIFR